MSSISAVITNSELIELESFLGENLDSVLDRFQVSSLQELKLSSTLLLTARYSTAIVAVAAFGSCPKHAEDNAHDYFDTIWLRLLYHSASLYDPIHFYRHVFASITHLRRIAYAQGFADRPIELIHFKNVAVLANNVEVLCIDREDVVGTFSVRVACMEDFDDLEPLFSEQSEVLQETHGPFYLAELIEAQDENNAALVLLQNNQTKGLMCLTTDIKSEPLQDFFSISVTCPKLTATNAVCITVTCLDRQIDALASQTLLDTIFSLHPEKYYALLTLPHAAEPIAILRDFIMIPAKAGVSCDHVLYICHRATVQAPPVVRLFSENDRDRIHQYLSEIQDIPQSGVIFTVEDDCVGIFAVNPLPKDEILDYGDKFNIDGLSSCDKVGVITHLFLSMPYHSWRKEIISQALSKLDILIGLYPAMSDPIIDLLDLALEAPLRLTTSAVVLVISPAVIGLGYTRETVNSRIVIVGASTAAEGFLAELFRNLSKTIFSHIIQISTFPISSLTNAPLRHQYLCAEVTYVDYGKKTVQVSYPADDFAKSYDVAYDYLIIATGLETADWIDKYGAHVPAVFSAVHKPGRHPWAAAFRFLQGNAIASDSIVVNGDSLDSLAIVAEFEKRNFNMSVSRLVRPAEAQVSGQKICWLYPGSTHKWATGDMDVVDRVKQMLSDIGVEVFPNHVVLYHPLSAVLLQQVNVQGPGGSARLIPTDDGAYTMPCFALLNTADKCVSPTIRTALSHEPVAVDRGILVDRFFRTNDRFVYAAGSVAQFRKSDGGERINLSEANAKEAGALTAKSLLQIVTPSMPISSQQLHLPLKCFQPNTRLISLPGESNLFFHSYLPFRETARHFRTNTMSRLAKVALDRINCVISITVCGAPITGRDMMQLERFIGLPASFLNNVEQRIVGAEIDDIAEYLLADWSLPIRHDCLPNLLLKARFLVGHRIKTMLSKQISAVANNAEVDFSAIEGAVTKDVEKDVNNALISFIQDNQRNLEGFLNR